MPRKSTIRSEHKAEYCALKNAIARCHNPAHSHYHNYGGRGITVDDAFKTPTIGFYLFLDEVGLRPGPNYSLDRKDNNLGYVAGNLRWATRKEQQANRRPDRRDQVDYGFGFGLVKARGPWGSMTMRRSPLLELNGVKKTIVEWSGELKIAPTTLRQRLAKGWPLDVVLSNTKFAPCSKALENALAASRTASAINAATDLLSASIETISKRVH